MSNTNKSFIILGISILIIAGLVGVSLLANQEENQEVTTQNLSSQEADNSKEEENSDSQMAKTTTQEDKQNQETSTPSENQTEEESAIKKGYFEYSANLDTDPNSTKVLFFHASWCSTCKNLDNNLKSSDFDDLDEDLVILKVDYDSSEDLKRKYKVTSQHTLVEVDNNWNEIQKFRGSFDLVDINQELK